MPRRIWLWAVLAPVIGGCRPSPDVVQVDSASRPIEAPQTDSPTPASRGPLPDNDWPRWRGPAGNGISQRPLWSTSGAPIAPRVAWSRNVGVGYSSISVVSSRAYTMGYRDEQEHVVCLDAQTGEPQWTFSYPGNLVDNLHKGGPAATPTVDGVHVYTVGKEGQVHCLDAANGNKIWAQHLQALVQVPLPEWGFSASPVLLDDLILLDAGPVVALNKSTGELVWSTEPHAAGYGSVEVMVHGGRQLLAVLNNDGVQVVRAVDGVTVAFHPWETRFKTNSTTPLAVEDTLFVSTGYQRGCTLLRLTDAGLTPVYENQEMSNHMNNCVLWEGHLYGFDGNSHHRRSVKLTCLNHQTGEVVWTNRGLGCGSLIVADGKLVILSDEGELVIAEPNPARYVELAKVKVLEETCWTPPAVAGGAIFCRNDTGDVVRAEVPEAP